MHDDRKLIEDRLDRVLRERIRPAVYPYTAPLAVEMWHVPGEPVPAATGLAATYEPGAVGDPWGPPWGTTWFRFSGHVPESWHGRTVEAVIDLGFDSDRTGFCAEGLVYLPDGSTVKGLHPRSRWVRVAEPAAGDDDVLFYVEAAANPLIEGPVTWLGDTTTAGDDPLYRLARAELAVFDAAVWELVQDLDVLGQLMHQLPLDQPRRWEILQAINQALDVLDLDDVNATAAAARERLAPALASPAQASAHQVSAVGHAHIDSAWLWPLRETVRKVARTASNTVNLMDDHPEFIFAMSQAQQLAWIKEHRPEVFEQVRKKIADGRFIPVGGMWVEADTNMPGGEAMARQFVHGKRFFADEFGIETDEVWLPDSFGYSAALPQLVKLSGSRWFLTQKISWSTTNPFPHHTFWWEGIDGTRVFTHFPPVDTYNAEFTGQEMAHLVRNFRDKGPARRSLVPFGHGDGGGGATREMLARAARMRDLEGSPQVTIEPPATFFAKAREDYPDAPVWVGELYLEYHRGTYTSQVKTKQGNRRSEHLLREAELWAATAAVRAGFEYPYQQLDRLWKVVLLNQFHDILPGSSIAWVHREAASTYAAVADELHDIIADAQSALAGDGEQHIVFNAAPHERAGIPAGGAGVRPVAATPAAATTPTASSTATSTATVDDARVTATERGDGWVLDNGHLRVVVDGRGLVTSVVEHATGRDAVAPDAAANLLQLHADLPIQYDAWDIESYYRNTVTDLTGVNELSLDSTGPDAATVRVTRSFGQSTVTQLVSLRAGSRVVDFATETDWHETEKLLKAAFPLDVRAEVSSAETQFGHVNRPTHSNTSWDAAKFEICAHRFVHVGEPGWGAALVNDSTYGHDVTRTVRPGDGGTTTTVRLSLVRAPRFPDPETDQGTHRFGYALAPGAGIVDAAREGYRINIPERVVTGGHTVQPLVSIDNDAVVVEAVKLADDGSGDVIVRCYEATGGRALARLTAGFAVDSAVTTDLLERSGGDEAGGDAAGDARGVAGSDAGPEAAKLDGNTVTLRLRPFEIVTLRLARLAEQTRSA
ncbi:alpha-mannosidase [Actinobacteria bacterium YIM 96077]|uniref:Alpha-mannosidase n=1 Tax=Phytoactinopolyspora halophila TaxID=1981511 RepID=A0A329QWL0_9ACTN|nr:glycoside hydrolase family 38 C-terminal domain-containing protein [Phytoactinopolyspora halophila]AYY15382.1 alpha-mannosidase [Actinobacteria bacterium YIM 96077]RAW16503.1 alpha-mannosidase [Phytoactinopolyspora halophila]